MVRIEFQPPDMNPMVRKVMQNLKLRMTFLKNWANSAAIESRGNARAKGGRRYWKDLARSIQVRRLSETAVVVLRRNCPTGDRPRADHPDHRRGKGEDGV